MADSLNVASTIGTWVAVLVGLIALAGVIGPFLIWQASRTERHQAIDLLEKGEAQNGGFVSKGLRVSRGIRLFRQLHVPLLYREPQFPGMKLNWNANAFFVSQASASWVQFCLALKGYDVGTAIGDPLLVQGGKTWLPLHRNWILIMGIVGRFANRPDQGKLTLKLKGRVKAVQALPGRAFTPKRKDTLYGQQFLDRSWVTTYRGNNQVSHITDDDGNIFNGLSGIIGTIWLPAQYNSSGAQKIYYTSHKPEEIGQLAVDSLTVGAMFWLSVGCLVSASGDVYCLENVDYLPLDLDEEERDNSYTVGRRSSAMTFGSGVHFAEGSNDDSEDDVGRFPRRASEFVVPVHRRIPRAKRSRQDVPRAFRFSAVNNRVEALESVANSLEGADQRGTVYSLDEVELPDDVGSLLKKASGSTYHRIDSTWVRLGTESTRNKNPDSPILTYLDRADAQILAKILLTMSLSPEGYLFGVATKSSLCRAMLCNAAQSLPHLLGRMAIDFEHLSVLADAEPNIVKEVDTFLEMCLNFKPDRAWFRTLYKLDMSIESLVMQDPSVNVAIGVVMLTSAEFRDIVARSARLIPESKDKTVMLDLGPTPGLKIPSIMGVVQRFPVDLGALFPGDDLTPGEVEISFSHLLFAALKACLRSAFLETILDSTPVFEAFLSMDKVIMG
jgi:hypothetical protein